MLSHGENDRLQDQLRKHKKFHYQLPVLSLEPNYAPYPGKLNTKKWVEGNINAFQIPGVELQAQKKIIVCSDWSLRYTQDNEFISDCKNLLNNLLLAGFDVRFWDGKSAVKITDALPDQVKIIKPAKIKDINIALSRDLEPIPSDTILHLDYFGLREILCDQELQSHFISLYEIKRDKVDIVYASDFEHFEKIPKLIYEYLKDEEFAIYYNSTWERSPNVKIKEKKCAHLLSTFSKNITVLYLINIQNPFLFAEIYKLKKLKELEWRENTYFNSDDEVNRQEWEIIAKQIAGQATPTKLTKIKLHDSGIPSSVASRLLESNDELQKIDIISCENLHEMEIISKKNKLKFVTIFNSNINTKFIATLLNNASCLTSLFICFDYIQNFGDVVLTSNRDNTTYPLLKIVKLAGINGGEFIYQIIKRAPHIEAIHLCDCLGLENISASQINDLPLTNLKKLEFLSIRQVIDIPATTIAQMLSATKTLESLAFGNLKYANNFIPELIANDLLLTHLQEIGVTFSSFLNREESQMIPGNTLAKIISLSPKLIEIDIHNHENFASFNLSQLPYQTKWSELVRLRLHNVNLPFKEYIHLLERSPQITSLDITRINAKLDDEIDLNGLCLNHITKISIDNDSVDTASINNYIYQIKLLGKILKITPNVEEIDWNIIEKHSNVTKEIFHDNIKREIINDQFSLPKLKILTLKNVPMTVKAIIKLLNITCALETLSIENYGSFSRDPIADLITDDHRDFPTFAELGKPLTRVKELTLKNLTLFPDFLKKIHLLFPNLNSIIMERCTGLALGDAALSSDENLSALSTLHISSSDLDITGIKKLLLGAKQLKTVKISVKIKVNLDFNDAELATLSQQLVSFSTGQINISWNTLRWLSTNRELTALKLNECVIENPDHLHNLDEVKLPLLQTLTFSCVTMPYFLLYSLLIHANKLDEFVFELSNASSIDVPDHLKHRPLKLSPHLRQVKIDDSTLYFEMFLALYHHANLKEFQSRSISFANEKLEISFSSLSKFPCKNLTKITGFSLSSKSLLGILCTTKQIECSAITIVDDPAYSLLSESEKKLALANLEEFTYTIYEHQFKKVSFPGELFIDILSKSPKLKKITFKDTPILNLNVDDIPQKLVLPHLTNITLIHSRLSSAVKNKLKSCLPSHVTFTTKQSDHHKNFDVKKLPYDRHSKIMADRQPNEQSHSVSTSTTSLSFLPTLNDPKRNKHLEVAKDEAKPGGHARVKELFIPSPHPREYRLEARHEVDVRGNHVLLKINRVKDNDLEDVTIHYSATPLHKLFAEQYFGKNKSSPFKYHLYPFKLSISSEWEPLPSLSPEESIIHFYISEASLHEIKYSTKDNLYYIRDINYTVDEPLVTPVNFILKIPHRDSPLWKPHRVENRGALGVNKVYPLEIQHIINHCAAFHEGKFILPPHAPGEQILLERYKQQIGSCETRSVVCHDKLQKIFATRSEFKKYKSRIMLNTIHDFVEINDGSSWDRPELGGYDTDIEIERINIMAPIPGSPESMQNKLLSEDNLYPPFMTWKKPNEHTPATLKKSINALDLCKEINTPGKKILIKFDNPDDCLQALALFAQQTKKSYLFIDSPTDLQWQAPGLRFDEHAKHPYALRKQKQFSTVRYFCANHPDGIVFVNWSKFSATDITAFQTIVDEERKLEGETLPASLSIVGLIHTAWFDSYDEDGNFSSRYGQEHIYNWQDNGVLDCYHNKRSEINLANPDKTPLSLSIDLFASDDWETLLFSFLCIRNNTFSLEPSDFIKELTEGVIPLASLHLKNPPWHRREFQLFWQQTLQQGTFILYGKTFRLTQDFHLSYSSGFEFKTTVIKEASDPVVCYEYPLNEHSFHEFFPHCAYENKQFVKKLGLVKEHKTLTLVVTCELSENQWCQLLARAHECNTIFYLKLAPLVRLPSPLSHVPYKEFKEERLSLLENKHQLDDKNFILISAVEATTDISREMLQRYPDAMYIELDSSHHFGDLFYQVRPDSDNTFMAHFFESAPWQALQNKEPKQTVIIAGTLPTALINALTPLFISGKSELMVNGRAMPFVGNLIIITNSVIPAAHRLFVCTATSQEVINTFPLATNREPATQTLSTTTNREVEVIAEKRAINDEAADLSLATCEYDERKRFNNIMNGFKKNPIIFYTGLTGVGKTTYLLEEFAKDYYARTGSKAKLYIGENNIEPWAAHHDPNTDAFLFIDEANLSSQKLSLLKSRVSLKPHLLINGHYYALSANQRIIFAGNPNEYGGVRQQHAFFNRYAETVICEKPNHAFLYHRILKPQLMKGLPQTPCEEIAKIILAVFDKINELAATTSVLLSPRHLHMMAVLFNAYRIQFQNKNITQKHLAIAACLTLLGNPLANLTQQKLLTYLNNQYGYDATYFSTLQTAVIKEKIDSLVAREHHHDIVYTPSRYPLFHTLDTFISMSAQDNFHFGLLLEGEPGIGKSTSIVHYLTLMGVDFVQFSFSKNVETDRLALLDAFQNGKKVLIDEFNAGAPLLEKLLNTFSMGKDENGVAGNKKGFMLIATQNPSSMPGRQELSPALKARIIPIRVHPYPPQELVALLENEGIKENYAKYLVQRYVINLAYAIYYELNPKPNLRDLKNVARSYNITKHSKKPLSESTTTCSTNHNDIEDTTAVPAETLRDGGFKGGESRFSPFVQTKASLLRSIETGKEFPRSLAGTPEDTTIACIDLTAFDPANRAALPNYFQHPATDTTFVAEEDTDEEEQSAQTPLREITNINPNCMIDTSLVKELHKHADELYTQYIENRHSLFTQRRWQKYAALHTLARLYERQQLTVAHITWLEKNYAEMYHGAISQQTKLLVEKVKATLKPVIQLNFHRAEEPATSHRELDINKAPVSLQNPHLPPETNLPLETLYTAWLNESFAGYLIEQPRLADTKNIDAILKTYDQQLKAGATKQVLITLLASAETRVTTWLHNQDHALFTHYSDRYNAVLRLKNRLAILTRLLQDDPSALHFMQALEEKLQSWRDQIAELSQHQNITGIKMMQTVFNAYDTGGDLHHKMGIFFRLKSIAEERLSGEPLMQLYYKCSFFGDGRNKTGVQTFYENLQQSDLVQFLPPVARANAPHPQNAN